MNSIKFLWYYLLPDWSLTWSLILLSMLYSLLHNNFCGCLKSFFFDFSLFLSAQGHHVLFGDEEQDDGTHCRDRQLWSSARRMAKLHWQFFEVNRMTGETKAAQRWSVFLALIGPKSYLLLKNLLAPTKPKEKTPFCPEVTCLISPSICHHSLLVWL